VHGSKQKMISVWHRTCGGEVPYVIRPEPSGLYMAAGKHVLSIRQQRYCLAVEMQRFARERDGSIGERKRFPGFAVSCLLRHGQTLCRTVRGISVSLVLVFVNRCLLSPTGRCKNR
jgi:hypothetical protein